MNNKNSAKFNYKKKFLEIHGKKMAYIDEGQGDPTVFLHGNPTSSYLWRNIIPYAEEVGRVIAPDLIGMGDSEKLDDSGPEKYTFLEHSKFLYKLLDELDLDNVSLVIHDWGSALGFNWAKINPSKIKSITYMEAIVCPIDSWEEWPEIARKTFQLFRSDAGEELILEKNYFVERVLSGDTRLEMDSEEMQTYLKPFFNPGEDRRPTLTWPRQIPIAGEPREVVKIVQEYEEFLGNSDIPKLFVNAEPGSILVGKQRERARLWPNQKEVTVKGGHFIQEISPNEIGKYLKEFLLSI
ncbi:MAG: haloalkane dehalogenase [Gammaproteobacteria bacterium]|nr:haloalkane dehalogenase [Gammaproteobacteria bacterium]|tara:strand:- start:4607 stop:5494 length:888 start_codon:yes stop_codon:yes gene_type:complete